LKKEISTPRGNIIAFPAVKGWDTEAKIRALSARQSAGRPTLDSLIQNCPVKKSIGILLGSLSISLAKSYCSENKIVCI
jgi:hypothetical protein